MTMNRMTGCRGYRVGWRGLAAGVAAGVAVTAVAFGQDQSIQVRTAREPVFVELPISASPGMLEADSPVRAALATDVARQAAVAAADGQARLIALRITDGGLLYDERASGSASAPGPDGLGSRAPADDGVPAAARYERAVADLLLDALRQVRAAAPDAYISVYGLPLRARGGGRAAAANRHYARVMDAVDVVLSTKSFILSNDVLTETAALRRSMAREFKVAGDRPVMFRTNHVWRIARMADDTSPSKVEQALLDADAQDWPSMDQAPARASGAPTKAVLDGFTIDSGDGSMLVADSGQGGGSSGGAASAGPLGSDFGDPGGGGGGGGSGGGGSGGGGGGSTGSGGESAGDDGGSGGGAINGGGGGPIGITANGFSGFDAPDDEAGDDITSLPGGVNGPPGSPDEQPVTIYTNLYYTQPIGEEHGAVTSRIFASQFWDPDEIYEFTNPEGIDWLIDYYEIPPDYDGFLCLDWEHDVFQILLAGPSHPQWQDMINEMLELIDYVRSKLPNAKIGYYGLPIVKYWELGESDEEMAAAQVLWDASDVLFPSVYDYYNVHPERDHEHHGYEVKLALQLSNGKPVLPYVFHRYHHSNDNVGWDRIPFGERVAHYKAMLEVEYEGQHPAGLVTWGSDYYYHKSQEQNPDGTWVHQGEFWDMVRDAYEDEMLPGETIEEFWDRTHPDLYQAVQAAINQFLAEQD